MKKSKASVHQAAAILIDVLLAVLLLLAFVFINGSVKPAMEKKPETPSPARAQALWAEPRNLVLADTSAATVREQAAITQVRFEGGRLVPVLAR